MNTVTTEKKPPLQIVNQSPNFGFQGIAYAPVTIHQYPQAQLQRYSSERLTEAAVLLLQMPMDRVPDPAALPEGSRMPFLTNSFYTGRKAMFLQLAAVMAGNPAIERRAVVIGGIAGSGKTQFASELVHRYGQYFAGGVAWINFANRDAIPDQVIASGQVLPPQPNFGELSRDEKIGAVLADWESRLPRMLIFDNCEDESLLLDWLPRTGESRVVVTARKTHWSRAIRCFELQELKRSESIALLQKLSDAESDRFDGISEELGDLPLALYLAGSFLHTYRHSPVGSPEIYLQQLRKAPPLDHPSLTGHGTEMLHTEHDKRIAQTFDLSFGQLRDEKPVDGTAIALLGRASFLAPGLPIPREFLLKTLPGSDDAQLDRSLFQEDAILRVCDLGLMQEQADGALSLHRLIASHMRRKSFAPECRDVVEASVLNAFSHSRHLPGSLDRLPLRGHLRYVADVSLADRMPRAAALADALALDLMMVAAHQSALTYAQHALRIVEEGAGEDHPQAALYLNNVGHALIALDRHLEAIPYFERALPVWEKTGDFSNAAATLDNLGACYDGLGNYRSAIVYHKTALDLRESMLGPDDPDVAISAHNLAQSYLDQGDYAAAGRLHRRSLEIRRKAFPGSHRHTAVSLSSLGLLYTIEGRYTDALPLLRESADMKEAVWGPSHPSVALTIGILAEAHVLLGQEEEAERQLSRLTVLSGARDIWIMDAFNTMGLIAWRNHRYKEAWEAYDRASAHLKDASVPSNGNAGVLYNNIGMLLISENRIDEAGPYFEKALEIQSQQRVKHKRGLWARYLNNYGMLLRLRGDLTNARDYLDAALSFRTALLSDDSADTASTVHEIGLVLLAQGNPVEAEVWLRRSLATRTAVLGPDHERTLRTAMDLEDCLGRRGEATAQYSQGLRP